MKKIFFTVGPSQLYPTANKHIKYALKNHIYSLSHRSEKFIDIYKNTQDGLRKLMNIPDTHHIFFTASALEGMERTISNTVYKKSFHVVNGSFSREFYQIAIDLKKKSDRFDVPNGKGFDFSKVKIPSSFEEICLVQNETSTGVAIPMDMIYQLKESYPEKLIAIDVVSSVPYTTIDFSKIDITLFSVQKGFGLPAGLGILIVSKAALDKASWIEKQGISIGSYHSFPKYLEFGQKFQTRETPNVANIYLLGMITNDMLKKGIALIRKETEKKAALVYAYFDNHKTYKPYVKEPFRSKTTIVIAVDTNADKITQKLAQKGLIVAKGYGKRKDMHIRIGNFPSISLAQIKTLLKEFDNVS